MMLYYPELIGFDYSKISKKSWLGAPTELNYAAMINSLVTWIVERIASLKDLIKR